MLLLLSACAAPTPPTDAPPVVEAFLALHQTIYAAWSLPLDRDALWTQHAAAFAGDALTDAYVEHWATRVSMSEQGTAVAVLQLDHEPPELLELSPSRARIAATWRVGGLVTHQGHQHLRVNQHSAVYTLARAGGAWRIVHTAQRDLRRVPDALDAEADGGPTPAELLRQAPR